MTSKGCTIRTFSWRNDWSQLIFKQLVCNTWDFSTWSWIGPCYSLIISLPQGAFCCRLPLYASLHRTTLQAWPILLHADSSTTWRQLSNAIWCINEELRPQIRIAKLLSLRCYFRFPSNGNYLTSMFPDPPSRRWAVACPTGWISNVGCACCPPYVIKLLNYLHCTTCS